MVKDLNTIDKEYNIKYVIYCQEMSALYYQESIKEYNNIGYIISLQRSSKYYHERARYFLDLMDETSRKSNKIST